MCVCLNVSSDIRINWNDGKWIHSVVVIQTETFTDWGLISEGVSLHWFFSQSNVSPSKLCACPSVSGCLIGSRLCPSQPVGALKPPPRCDEIVFLPNSPAALQVRSTCFLSKQLSYTPTRCEVAQIKRKNITWLRWCGLRCCRIQERSGSAKCLIQTTSHQRYTSPTIQPLVWRVFIYIYIFIYYADRQTERFVVL